MSELQSNIENSNVVSVRLSAPEQITEAQVHWEQVLKVVDSAADLLFVYLLEGQFQNRSLCNDPMRSVCLAAVA